MKRRLGIFELSKSEQRVVLIIMLALIAVAFIGYEHRVHRAHIRAATESQAKTSPTPSEIENE